MLLRPLVPRIVLARGLLLAVLRVGFALGGCALGGRAAAAAAPTTFGGSPDAAPGPPAEVTSPPSLLAHPEAPYPPGARAQHLEGDVGLELDLDAAGNVTGVRLIAPAGHGFDEAAIEVARR